MFDRLFEQIDDFFGVRRPLETAMLVFALHLDADVLAQLAEQFQGLGALLLGQQIDLQVELVSAVGDFGLAGSGSS